MAGYKHTTVMLKRSPHGQLYVNACRFSLQSMSSISISSYDMIVERPTPRPCGQVQQLSQCLPGHSRGESVL